MKKNRDAQISARVSLSDKEMLKKSGYNARQAIEYFNQAYHNKLGLLKIKQFFLNKEIEDMKMDLIVKEMELDNIQKEIDNIHIDKLSSLRVDSYEKIIRAYTRDRTKQSFTEFIGGRYIQDNFILPEVRKFPDCEYDDFVSDLIDYYENVILVSHTF